MNGLKLVGIIAVVIVVGISLVEIPLGVATIIIHGGEPTPSVTATALALIGIQIIAGSVACMVALILRAQTPD